MHTQRDQPGVTATRRLLRRIGAALVVAVVAVIAAGTPVSAHATLLFSNPPIDGTIPTTPPAISLLFDQPVTLTLEPLQLQRVAGEHVSLGSPRLRHGGREVVVPVNDRLQPGVYSVRWQVTANDGDVVGGEFQFAVGAAGHTLTSSTGSRTQALGSGWTGVFRWILFGAYALAVGSLAGSRLTRRVVRCVGLPAPRVLLLSSAIAGLGAASGLAAVVAGGGNPLRGLAHLGVLIDSRPGTLALVEVVAFALAAVAVGVSRPTWATVPLAAVAVAEGIRAHPEAAAPWWGAITVSVHLLAAALWVGTLAYVLRTALAWRGEPAAVRMAFLAYARAAAWIFALVIVTGITNALLVAPPSTWLSTVYGQLLLVKLTLVIVAAAAALTSRGRLRLRADPGPATRIEIGVLAGVLAATAALTVTAPPSTATAPLPFPPPPSGPVLATGGRAGEIGVEATASTRQLVIHLFTPSLAGRPAPSYELTANQLPPNGKPRQLQLRSCGIGCYLATPTWEPGDNNVTLRATATGWRGGTATLLVGWPIRPAPDLLPQIVATMRGVPHFILHEQVTSNTAHGYGPIELLTVNGRRFLSAEPYAAGVAPTAALISRTTDQTTLALGYPGEGVAIQLTVDPNNRILRETLIAPNHLIHRTFVYPEQREGKPRAR
jgi:copper transport protein